MIIWVAEVQLKEHFSWLASLQEVLSLNSLFFNAPYDLK